MSDKGFQNAAAATNNSGFAKMLGVYIPPYSWFAGGIKKIDHFGGRMSISYKYGISANKNGNGSIYFQYLKFGSISTDSVVTSSFKNLNSTLKNKLDKYGMGNISFSGGSVSISTSGISVEGITISNNHKFFPIPYNSEVTKTENTSISFNISWNDVFKATGAVTALYAICILAACAPAVAARYALAGNTFYNYTQKLCNAI